MASTSDRLKEIQKRVESVPGTALAQELKNNADALLQQPNNAALHFGVGLLYARVGDLGSAAKMLNTALNLTGNNEVILGALAYLYANHVGDHEIALGYLKKLHKLDKKKVSTVLLMAHSQLKMEKPEDALNSLGKVKPSAAQAPQYHYLTAQCHVHANDLESAKNSLAELKSLNDPKIEKLISALETQIHTANSA